MVRGSIQIFSFLLDDANENVKEHKTTKRLKNIIVMMKDLQKDMDVKKIYG